VTLLERHEPRAGSDAAEARWVPRHEVTELEIVDGLVELLHESGVLEVFS
jgi:hypothetical protein